MNSNLLVFPIILSGVAGTFCLFISKKGVREGISLVVSGLIFVIAISLFLMVGKEPIYWQKAWIPGMGVDFSLKCFGFSSVILLFISLFAVLTSIYSLKFMLENPRKGEYYCYFLWLVGASWGVVLANNLVVLLLFWGILAVLLYAFLSLGSYKLATKGLFTIGVADFSLILGILFLFHLLGNINMESVTRVELVGALPLSAFLLIAIGAIAKVGAIPFHTWIPDASREVPLPGMAFLVGALDKLVGIYLLARVCLDFFRFTAFSVGSYFLMLIGSFTIVVAVMMALTGSDMRKIIAYLSISSAGYMMIGIATANLLGIAGGLFYLLSTTIWTSLFFFVAGAVEKQTGTCELSSLGGLSRWMPFTFTGCLIAGLAISGVPPFNGFFSKWMIYQGIISLNVAGGGLWIIWLLAAMFGSVVTLASFIRMFHSVFLGEVGTSEKISYPEAKTAYMSSNPGNKIREGDPEMSSPIILLAALCIIFGIFAYEIPLRLFVIPSIPLLPSSDQWMGWWQPELATFLIIIGIIVGVIIYFLSKIKPAREDVSYVGGEEPRRDMIVGGIDFYDTIKDFTGIYRIYRAAEGGLLDIYQGMLTFVRSIACFLMALDRLVDYAWRAITYVILLAGRGASLAHSGILHTYLGWFLVGLTILLIVFLL